MDASQYKDYILTLLFIKYVSDKYAGKPDALIEVERTEALPTWWHSRATSRSVINKIIGKLGGAKETQRIVAKVQELMSLCDRLETEITIRKHKAAFLSNLSFT
jgi:type I restriction-modification system DNA methylase subunit